MATADNWEEVVRTNYTELLKYIATDAGVFGELKRVGIFTAIAMKTYTGLKSTTEKIERMLSDLLKKDFESFKKFCEALNNSGQANVVRDYLSTVKHFSCHDTIDGLSQSVGDRDSACYRGISFGVAECLKQHWNKLLVEINFDNGLLAELESRNIVTTLQLTALKDKETEDKRADQMLCWLQNGTEKQFIDFCSALEANNQPHLVQECLTPKLPEPKMSKPNPPVIQENQTQSNDIHRAPELRKDPEGIFGLIPLCAEVTVKEISFSPCSEEFLTDFKDKVLKKAAYKCDSKCRGRALIMNNRFFTQLGVRLGSEMDTKNLEELFKRLHFDTVVHSDITAAEMLSILDKERTENHHKDCDMFVLFMMSHGIQGEIYGRDGKSIKTAEITDLFNGKNCPNLLAKPKLFFIQACQGVATTEGVISMDVGMLACDSAMPVQPQDTLMEQMREKLRLEDDINLSIPLEIRPDIQSDAIAGDTIHEMADMAFIYATVQGFVAYRRVDTGSLFVQCLIKVLTQQAHKTELMPMIRETFSMLHEQEMVEYHGRYKQIGEKRDTLRREVYLLPL